MQKLGITQIPLLLKENHYFLIKITLEQKYSLDMVNVVNDYSWKQLVWNMEYLHRHIKAHFWQPSHLCSNSIVLANPKLSCKKVSSSLGYICAIMLC